MPRLLSALSWKDCDESDITDANTVTHKATITATSKTTSVFARIGKWPQCAQQFSIVMTDAARGPDLRGADLERDVRAGIFLRMSK